MTLEELEKFEKNCKESRTLEIVNLIYDVYINSGVFEVLGERYNLALKIAKNIKEKFKVGE